MTVINGLWIGDALSPLARACVQSFLGKGYDFHLHCYGPVANVPAQCMLRDAAQVLPESSIIRYSRGPGKGSVALFANMFRYKLLHESGGWWCDLDMFCLTDALPDSGIVLAQEDAMGLNCAIMRFPAGHEVLRLAYEDCVRRGDDVEWGDTGPRLLSELARRFDLGAAVFPKHVFYPVHYRQFWIVFDPRRTATAVEMIRQAACIHLWNNMISRSTLQLSILPPEGSLLRNLYEWTIGTDGFTQEYVMPPDCPPDELSLRVVQR